MVGVVALAAGLEGYFFKTATWLERVLFLVAALLLIDPGVMTDILGLMCLAAALVMQRLRRTAPLSTATTGAS